MRKPSVTTRCVANTYAASNERIVEFSGALGGGLISLRNTEQGLVVEIYRCDECVIICVPVVSLGPDTIRAARETSDRDLPWLALLEEG